MKKPLRSEYGYSKKTGWQDERDRDLYDAALLQWYNRTIQYDAHRVNPVHPSWAAYVAHFDPTDPTRSQGAFCRWAGIRPNYFSSLKTKPIRQWYEVQISIWVEELESGDFGIMPQFQSEYERLMEKD